MMFRFDYDTESFEHAFNLPNGALFSQDSIINIELLNDISPKWIYSEGKPCVVSILHENRMTVYVAEKEGDENFKEAVWDRLQAEAKVSRLYALNWKFVRDVLKAMFDSFEFPIDELKAISGKGWSRDKCYQVLRTYGIVKNDKEIFDVYEGDDSKSVADFAAWLNDGDTQHLMNIVNHNLSDLMKLSLIHKHRAWFVEQYKTNRHGFEVKGRARIEK